MRKVFEKLRIPLSICLLVAGVCLLLVNPTKHHVMKEQAKEVKTELKHLTPKEVKKAEEAPATYDYAAVSAISLESVLAAQQNKAKAPMIGEISVPDLGINLPILKGVTDQNLLIGAATMKPDQKMGEGNYTLASHYSNAYGETLLFSPLLRAKPGMQVYLTDLENVYVYTIDSITNVSPKEVSVLNETGENIITLVTCTDLSAQHRHIVRGTLTTIESVKDAGDKYNHVFESNFKTY